MESLGYYNGEVGRPETMRVPMLDRASYFGDGVYDATYTRNHIAFALDEHLTRFYENVRRVGLHFTMPPARLKQLLLRLVRQVDCDEQFVYWQATRGTAMREHVFEEDMQANLWVLVRPCAVKDIHRPVRAILLPDERHLACDVKTLNLLPNVLALQRARAEGADEAIFHRDGRVTECGHSNVHILRAGCLVTPPADHRILNGICRRHLIALCKSYGVPVLEQPFTVQQMRAADEVLITSAGSFALRVSHLDGAAIGGRAGDLLERLQEGLHAQFLAATAPEL